MQGIHRRGHLVLAGVIGGLIGVLVAASWASPAAPVDVSQQSAQVVSPGATQAQPGNTDSTSPDVSKLQEALWAKQKVEAEYYPGTSASHSVGQGETGGSDTDRSDLRKLQDAMRAKQRVEWQYYPGR